MPLLVKNSKIASSNNNATTLYNFGIPAYKSRTGVITCPSASACIKGCYANQGAYVFPVVRNAYEARLEATSTNAFIALMGAELDTKLKTANRQSKQLVIRIHDSGDFYSLAYIKRWFAIIQAYPMVQFYAYTKQVKLFKALSYTVPANLTLIYSQGGLHDKLIDVSLDRHSRVFSSLEALLAAGYADTSANDLNAIGPNPRIGLIYHGHSSKAWNTGD